MHPVMINVDSIGGTAEVAAVLNCPKQQIYTLRRNPEFPQPVKTLSATPIWNLDDIARFKETWKRRPRAPKAAVATAAEEII